MSVKPVPLNELVGLRFESEGHVAVITIDNVERKNAVSPAMHRGLRGIWEEVRDNPAYRCAVITGAGNRYFNTGAEMQDVAEAGTVGFHDDGPFSENVRFSSRQNRVWKPVVCAVNGLVVGAGIHVVADSDIVVASEMAAFMDTHVNLGFVGAIDNIGLARRLPIGQALRMTLQGRNYRLTARRAYELGMVDELVAPEDLMPTAMAIAHDIAKNSPRAVRLSKEAVWNTVEMGDTQAIEYGYALERMQWAHPDFLEGPRAFAERREPVWRD